MKILVPTDFSQHAEYAVEAAIEFASLSNGQVHFIHLKSIPINWIYLERDQDKMYPELTKEVDFIHHKLSELVERADKRGIKAHKCLHYNEDREEIIDHAKKHDIDMIIMGSHGASGARKFLMGSNAQKIVRLSHIPVMVLKNRIEKLDFKDILFPSDFWEDISKPLNDTIAFAKLFDAKIHLLFVNTPENFTETPVINNEMSKYVEMAPEVIGSTNIQNARKFENGLINFTKVKAIDLIALATHGRTGLLRALSGSLTENIVNHFDKPVLSLRLVT
ncbi:MAG TPA: universal stress protein [Cyclobacteriaceae bacterium]